MTALRSFVRKSLPTFYGAAAQAKAGVLRSLDTAAVYAHDGMKLYGKSLDFLTEPNFVKAYLAGMNTGHHICRDKGSSEDIHNEYRVYLCCWAAAHAAHFGGAFVECGVNTGITSVAICSYFDSLGVTVPPFYLFDTYRGIPIDQASDDERAAKEDENARYYEECFELARSNFAPWPSCILIRGRIPETLGAHDIQNVAYLHLDMNIAAPEVAAVEYFWPEMVTGGIMMLDDYGFEQYRPQKTAMDEWAAKAGVMIATLPTGQGMAIKS